MKTALITARSRSVRAALIAVALAISLGMTSGCTTSRQAWITTGIAAGVAAAGGAMGVSDWSVSSCQRRGLFGCPAEWGGATAFGTGTLVAITSFVAALVLRRSEARIQTRAAPPVTPPDAPVQSN